jgi:heat shock protein HtpX
MYEQIARNKRKTVLLVFIFIIFVAALGYVIDSWSGSGVFFLPIALIYATGMSLVSYFAGDKIALAAAGARAVKKADNPYVFRLVENLAITAGLPVPKVYLIDDPAPNAFATGRKPATASIALTTGLVEQLENEELEGVIAHELSHIKNYDIRVMALTAVLVGTVVIVADYFFRWGFIFGGSGRQRNSAGGWLAIVGLLFLILSPLVAQLIKLSVSRRREFLADASGALLTRYPAGLAAALEKIAKYPTGLKKASQATAHLYIAQPFGIKQRGLRRLFSTHPPMAERIAALNKM